MAGGCVERSITELDYRFDRTASAALVARDAFFSHVKRSASQCEGSFSVAAIGKTKTFQIDCTAADIHLGIAIPGKISNSIGNAQRSARNIVSGRIACVGPVPDTNRR